MSRRMFFVVAFIMAAGVFFGAMAPSDGRYDCVNHRDGIWMGDPAGNRNDGTCRVYDSTTCPNREYEDLIYESNIITGSVCENIYRGHRQLVKNTDEAGVLYRQGWEVTYPAGLCAERCALNANNLPRGARQALRGLDGLASKAYFQTYGAGSYQICYNGDANALYQFLGGEWVRIGTSAGGGVCATASGDGAFAAFTE